MEKDRCKQIFQVVCVVHDLDTALANWKRLVDFRQSPSRISRSTAPGCTRAGGFSSG